MSAVDASGCVLVSVERLRALEALEHKSDTERLKALRERDKANPSAVTKRTKKYYETHKDDINARRREAYKLKCEAQKKSGDVLA